MATMVMTVMMMVMAMMVVAVVPAMMPVMMMAVMAMTVVMMAVAIPHMDEFVLRRDRGRRQRRSGACGKAGSQYDGRGDGGEDYFAKRHDSSFKFR
jgi:hypothetical protein